MTKTQANKANAQHSTGPKTAAGKARSSRNAVSHGFQSSDVVLAHENAAEFDHILHHYQSQVDLNDPAQAFLAGEIANAQWRVRRAQRLTRLYLDLEITGFSAEPSPDEIIVRNMEQRGNDVPATLHRHETHFQRLWWRIQRKLEALRECDTMQWEQAEVPAQPEDVAADLSLEECRAIVEVFENMESGRTNPPAHRTGTQDFMNMLEPAGRKRYYEAAKAKIAQTKPAALAA